MKNSSKVLLGTGIAGLVYLVEEGIRYYCNCVRQPAKMPVDDFVWQKLIESVTADCNKHSELYSDKQFAKATDDTITILTDDGVTTIDRNERSVIVKDLHGKKKRFIIPHHIDRDVAVTYIASYVRNINN